MLDTAPNLYAMLPYDDIAGSITAHHLATPISEALVLSQEDRSDKAADRLEARSFDQAPVLANSRVVGFVLRSELRSVGVSRVAEAVRPLKDSILVSTNASVHTVMQALESEPLVFVVEGRAVTGFVTPSDLNKHIARAHFYLLVADLELALVALLRRRYKRVRRLLRHLSSKQRADAIKRFERDKQNDRELDELSAIQFRDVLSIAGRSRSIRVLFRCSSEDEWADLTGDLNSLRTAVMHPPKAFLGKRTVADLLAAEDRLQTLLARAWSALRRGGP